MRRRVSYLLNKSKGHSGSCEKVSPTMVPENQGANPHENVSGHKAEKKVTGSSQHGLTKLAKDKSGLIN